MADALRRFKLKTRLATVITLGRATETASCCFPDTMDAVLQVVVGDGRAGGWGGQGYIRGTYCQWASFAESQTGYTPEPAHRRGQSQSQSQRV